MRFKILSKKVKVRSDFYGNSYRKIKQINVEWW
jgi:hypothetical protein